MQLRLHACVVAQISLNDFMSWAMDEPVSARVLVYGSNRNRLDCCLRVVSRARARSLSLSRALSLCLSLGYVL